MAGVELATAYYSLVPSMSGTAAAVRSQSSSLMPVWGGIGDDAGKGVKKGIVRGIAGAGTAIVASLAVLGIGNLIGDAVRTGVDFAMDGIDIASDLSETRSAIEQVFGTGSTAALDQWASTAATSIGQSELAALQAAQSFGVYGQAAGLAGGDLVTFSTDLADLGGDLASFFGGSPEDAIYAIGAGLRGESEPLRKYGVLLDDATLRARALSMGIYDGNGSLTQQQRVLAAQEEILSQAAIASGDFERTSGSLANQQRILAANFENAKASLGEALLPAMTTLVTFANDNLVPILNQVVAAVGPELSAALTDAGPAIQEFLAALAPMLPELIRAGTEVLPPLVDLFVLISPLLLDIATNTATAFANMNAFFSWLKGDTTFVDFMNVVFNASGSLSEFGVTVGDVIASTIAFFQDMATNVGNFVQDAINAVVAMPGAIVSGLGDLGGVLVDSGAALIQGFIDGINSMLGSLLSTVGWLMEWVGGFFPSSPAERGEFSGSGWTRISDGGAAVMDEFASGMDGAKPAVSFGQFNASAEISPAAGAETLAWARIERLLAEIRDGRLVVPVGPTQAALASSYVLNDSRGRI